VAKAERKGRVLARLSVDGGGDADVDTGLSVLDHLIGVVARYASFDLTLKLAPGSGAEQVSAAGQALGQKLRKPLRAERASGHGSSALPEDEALASVSLDVAEQPFVHSNVDLSGMHVAGLGTDLVAGFLESLVAEAGLNLHVRLLEGAEEQHVLEAIFKALGAALGQACERRPRKTRPRRVR
jgi:imidazoleglycerol-phosphate dehydratase